LDVTALSFDKTVQVGPRWRATIGRKHTNDKYEGETWTNNLVPLKWPIEIDVDNVINAFKPAYDEYKIRQMNRNHKYDDLFFGGWLHGPNYHSLDGNRDNNSTVPPSIDQVVDKNVILAKIYQMRNNKACVFCLTKLADQYIRMYNREKDSTKEDWKMALYVLFYVRSSMLVHSNVHSVMDILEKWYMW
jgi:hypothetical protein